MAKKAGKKEKGREVVDTKEALTQRYGELIKSDPDFFRYVRIYILATPTGRKALTAVVPALARFGVELEDALREEFRQMVRASVHDEHDDRD